MAAVTVTLTGICAGGNHLTFGVTGDVTATIHAVTADMIGAITDEDKTIFVKVLAKLAKIGRTNAQAKTALQAGIAINA